MNTPDTGTDDPRVVSLITHRPCVRDYPERSVRPIPVEHLRIVDHRVDLYRELIERQREFEAIPEGPPAWWEIALASVCVLVLVIFVTALDGGLI